MQDDAGAQGKGLRGGRGLSQFAQLLFFVGG